MSTRRLICSLAFIGAAAAGCSSDDSSATPTVETTPETSAAPATTAGASTSTTVTPTTVPVTSTTSISPTSTTSTTTTTTTTSTTTTITSTIATTTTNPPAPPTAPPTDGPYDLGADVVQLGTSVQGRPIIAEQLGSPGGRRVLVIGVIHGNEDDGTAIVDELRRNDVPEGVELWLVESMNPDGQAIQDRHNANQVDLNRNFPYEWGPIGQPGDGQYAGTGPASEPETQAMVAFIDQLGPDLTIWYHQDLYVINPAEGRAGRIRARYAELTGLPMGEITGGTYTGIAATWANQQLAAQDAVAFIVELGATLSPDEAVTHADAVRTISVEG